MLMNGEENEAIGVLTSASGESEKIPVRIQPGEPAERRDDSHWRWRLNAVDQLAASLDPRRFGVKALYLFGSTKNATAGPDEL